VLFYMRLFFTSVLLFTKGMHKFNTKIEDKGGQDTVLIKTVTKVY